MCLGKTQTGKSHDLSGAIVFEKTSIPIKMVSVHTRKRANPAFSDHSALKSVFEKVPFRDGLEWTVGQTVEIELRFRISSA